MIGQAVFLGVAATGVMDLVAIARNRLWGADLPDYAMLGRWVGHIGRGRLIHRPITASPRLSSEAALGWALHYLTGIALAGLFLLLAGTGPHLAPLAPVGFGLVTVILPFGVMQPCMGAGFASRHAPRPWAARRRSLIAHLNFGLGLWVAGIFWVLPQLLAGT